MTDKQASEAIKLLIKIYQKRKGELTMKRMCIADVLNRFKVAFPDNWKIEFHIVPYPLHYPVEGGDYYDISSCTRKISAGEELISYSSMTSTFFSTNASTENKEITINFFTDSAELPDPTEHDREIMHKYAKYPEDPYYYSKDYRFYDDLPKDSLMYKYDMREELLEEEPEEDFMPVSPEHQPSSEELEDMFRDKEGEN